MRHPRRSDRDLLEWLELREQGLSYGQIAARYGTTKNAVTGYLDRIDKATEASEHDGTMPPRWWGAALERREAEAA